MEQNVSYLPIWKAGATAEEFLLELAVMARVDPGRFKSLVVIACSDDQTLHVYHRGCSSIELQGILSFAAHKERCEVVDAGQYTPSPGAA